MLPLSEADPEVKSKVEEIIGPCSCSPEYKSRWVGHASDRKDPSCHYHDHGEFIADLVRENRRLKRALAQTNLLRQLRKA